MHREVALIQIKEPEKFFLFFFEAQARPTTCPLLRRYSGVADINSRLVT
jgi:hypothetical protein